MTIARLAPLVLGAIAAPAVARAAVSDGTDQGATATSVDTQPQRDILVPRVPGTRPAPVASASRRSGEVIIDGRLDEVAWQRAAIQRGFVQREPHTGRPPMFDTEFRVLYDDRALYVAVRAHDPEPALIRGLLTRRDVDSSSDWVSLKIDSYHDRRTAFAFSVNPAGVQRDVLHFNDTEQDPSWDAVWESAAQVDDRGWIAELKIPYSQLRFSRDRSHVWGLQVLRRVQRTQELSAWAPWPKEASQEVSLYGTLVGVQDIGPQRRIELLPYLLIGTQLYEADAGDPLNESPDMVAGMGADAKIGLGSNFTLAATVNPDFGQVEADPSQVNLGAGEIFFAEKRPFFLEGTDIFRFSLGQGDGDGSVETLFYTRRIGAPPHDEPDADFVDMPDVTTIYSAGKLSGKTASGWSLGLLDAVTGQESATVSTADVTSEPIIEPFTNYAVGRVRKDLREGRTTIGGAVTAVNRSLEGTRLDWLHDQAYTGGLEMSHRFWNDIWGADLRLASSWVHGSPEAIDETQRSSVHWYQRPDADHLDYDPTRTSLAGSALLWSFGKNAGGHWRFATGGDGRTPGFEANDIGFQRASDYYVNWWWAQYREDEPGELLRQWALNSNLWRVWDTAGVHYSTGGNMNGNLDFLNYWGLGGGGGVNYNVQDRDALRGGPLLRRDPQYVGWFNGWSDTRKPVSGNLNGFGGITPAADQWNWALSALVGVQARSNLEVSLGPTVAMQTTDDQYVDEVADTMGDPHYVLARIRQVTTALTVRASYTVSPTLSVQLYAQPFVSAGRYGEYKEPLAPQADDHDARYQLIDDYSDMDGVRSVDSDGDGATDYSFELADFNVRELRSNLVMRWEYRPGSTLFLIWSHGRTSEGPDGRFLLSEDLADLADEPGEHVVLAKLNYWFGL
jgi:hypothetical protein